MDSSLFFRCVAGDEALEKQKKENTELKRKVDNAQAAMMELTQENQSLQVWLKEKWRYQLDNICVEWYEVLFLLEATGVKRGKASNRCHAREICNRCHAWENIKLLSQVTQAQYKSLHGELWLKCKRLYGD